MLVERFHNIEGHGRGIRAGQQAVQNFLRSPNTRGENLRLIAVAVVDLTDLAHKLDAVLSSKLFPMEERTDICGACLGRKIRLVCAEAERQVVRIPSDASCFTAFN